MARSTYIYLVRPKMPDGSLLGVFTVKHEAHSAVERSGIDKNSVVLMRRRDGEWDQPEDCIPWDWEEPSKPTPQTPNPYDVLEPEEPPPSKARELAHKLSEQFMRNGQFTNARNAG